MKYIKTGEDRRQYVLFPPCLDEYIEQDSPVQYIDAFVDSQDLDELGFNHVSQEAPFYFLILRNIIEKAPLVFAWHSASTRYTKLQKA